MRNGLVSEALYAAANQIEAFGLHKGSALDDKYDTPLACRSMCTIGAVTFAECNVRSPLGAAINAVKAFLGRGVEVWQWSDAPERTAEDVATMLRAAAVIEAAKEQAAVDTPAVSVAPVRSGL